MTVRAENDRGESDEIHVTINVTDVEEQSSWVRNLEVSENPNSNTSLDVSWSTPPLRGGPDIVGYRVEFREGPGENWHNAPHSGTATSATITGLTPGTEYEVRVRADNGEIPSAWSRRARGSTGGESESEESAERAEPQEEEEDASSQAKSDDSSDGQGNSGDSQQTKSESPPAESENSQQAKSEESSDDPGTTSQEQASEESSDDQDTGSTSKQSKSEESSDDSGAGGTSKQEKSSNSSGNRKSTDGNAPRSTSAADEQAAPQAQTLTIVSGDGQQGPASTQLAEPFVVSVLDQDGSPLAGAAVTFSVPAGEGVLSSTTDANPCIVESSTSSATATTDANGRAAIRLTLGSEPGSNTVAATVEGLEPVTFTATAAEQAMPHSLTKVCGEDQEGTAGILLDRSFVVSVSDEDDAAMAGVVVTFSVTAGGGTLSSATATTDANGRAATRLTPGSEPGTNTVEATVEGLEPVTFTAIGQESPLVGLFDLFGGGKRVALPDSPQLAQNAPNPFNSQTVLAYFLHAPGPARVEVFTLTGQRVALLHQGPQQEGYHRLRWNGRDDAGRPVSSGMYLYRLVTNEVVLTRKLILLR